MGEGSLQFVNLGVWGLLQFVDIPEALIKSQTKSQWSDLSEAELSDLM